MSLFNSKKTIVNRLNYYFEDYNNMRFICSQANNDSNEVFNILRLIINYAFSNKNEFIVNVDNLISCYYKAIKYYEDNNLLNSEISNKEYKEIKLPSTELVNKICKINIKEKQVIEEKNNRLRDHFNRLVGFNEVGFTYTRPEEVPVDGNFNYYYANCTGIVKEDFSDLYYNCDRYSDNDPKNPLYNDPYDNISFIKKNTDIRLRKLGNLYEIENGRHRLLYLLLHGYNERVVCTVTKRIENRDFNIIAYKIRREYNGHVFKNNILNDDPNVIIRLNDKLYKINGLNQLQDFYSNINNEYYLDKYYIGDFVLLDSNNSMEYLYRAKKGLIEIFDKMGDKLLELDYSDLLRLFPDFNNIYFYNAFNQLKSSYLRNKLTKSSKSLREELFEEYDQINDVLDKYYSDDSKKR